MSFALPEADIRQADIKSDALREALEAIQRNFDALRAGFPLGGEHLTSLPHVKLRRAAAQVVGSGAWTAIAFDTLIADERGLFGGAAFTVTAPSSGLYDISACVTHVPGGGGNRSARSRINGVDHQVSGGEQSALGCNTPLSCPQRLVKGDVVTLEVFQNSGGNINYGGTAAELSFTVVRLGN